MKINKLKGKIVENGMSYPQFAEKIGMNYSTLLRKFKAPEKITVGDAAKMKIALNLSGEESSEIFLT